VNVNVNTNFRSRPDHEAGGDPSRGGDGADGGDDPLERTADAKSDRLLGQWKLV
jgi:hypothetical protein